MTLRFRDPLAAAGAGGVRPTLLDVPGGALAALDLPADTGAAARLPALLVPGYTGSKEDFTLVQPLLAAAGHRTVAVDQRGQYESVGPDDAAAYSVAALARDVVALLDVVSPDGPVHLVGHSFGGLVARAAALASPERLASLTLLDSGPAGLVGQRVERMQAVEPLLAAGGMPAVWAALDALSRTDPGYLELPVEFRAFLERRFLAGNEVGLAAMGRALLDEPDGVDALADVARRHGLPLLVAYGADDDAWPPELQQLMAERLGARSAVVDGAVHSPAAEQPEATAAVLADFWSASEQRLPGRRAA